MTANISPSRNAIGIYGATALVVGNVVGAGFFLSPASLAPYGSVALIGWIVISCAALCLGLVFARLGSIVPAAGGPYGYARMGFGDFIGYMIAWGYWISIWASLPAIVMTFVSYLCVFFPFIKTIPFMQLGIALGIMWVIALLNLCGVRRVGQAQVVLVITKTIPFLLIAVCGIFWSGWDNLQPLNPTDQPFSLALAATFPLTMFAFLGIESATVPSDNIRDPKKTIPRATILGTLIAAFIYIFGTLAVMKAIPREMLLKSAAPFADAATAMWGNGGGYVIAFAALLSSVGALNGWTLLMAQVPLAAAKDGLFPKMFCQLNRNDVPYKGIIISMTLSSGLLLMQLSAAKGIELYNAVVELSTVCEMVPYVFCCMVEAILFVSLYPVSQAYRIGYYTPVAVVGFVFSMLTIYGAGAAAGMWSLLLLLAGLPLYVAMQRPQS